jgi:hypothetical protein
MAKIRTIEQLQELLDDELAWRKKELAVIKSLVTARSSSEEIVNCHIRSGIALAYAHWAQEISGFEQIVEVSHNKTQWTTGCDPDFGRC